MDRNNKSRKLFSQFVANNNFTRKPKRNVFMWNGDLWAFCLNDHDSVNISCRQLYEDCMGYVSYDENKDEFLLVRDQDTTKYSSRISPSGIKAYSAKIKNDKLVELKFVSPF